MPDTITVDEMKTLIKEEKIKPSRLFGMDDLAEDPVVKGIAKEAIQVELIHRKRLSSRFEEVDGDREKEKKDWEKEKKGKDDEIKQLKIKDAKRDSVDLFTTKIKERKLDKQQAAFIEKERDKFEPDDIEKLDKEVDTFMDHAVEEYKKTAKIFGVKTEKSKEGEEDETGSPPGDEGEQEENSLIPD